VTGEQRVELVSTAGRRDGRDVERSGAGAAMLQLASRWWIRVIVVFVGARIITTIIMLVLASLQAANPWTGAHPGYFDFASIWDGRWYDIVAEAGYPSVLPHDSAGHVDQNAWAFLPAYPYLVGALMFVTQLPWPVAAVIVSLGFGLGSALVFYRLMRLKLDDSTSMFAVVLFCVAPLSPLMQVAYAESMYIFFLVVALYLLVRRRYWEMLVPVVIMGFTRPSGLAFALAMGIHVLVRWFSRRRRAFPMRQRVAAVVVTIVSVLAGAAWPLIAGLVTGSLSAYTDTELSWRALYLGYTQLVPFSAWIEGAHWWFSTWLGLPAWLGYVVLALLVLIFALILMLPAVRRLGADLRIWLASYAVYLLAVFFPQSSTFRILMPMFPLLGAVAQPKGIAYRVSMVVLCIAGQVGWLIVCWMVIGSDWSPP
jgi:hypothetical protein